MRATAREVNLLRKNLETYKENLERENLVGLIRSDIHFHRLVANATENHTIEVLMNTITRYDFHGWKAALRTPNRPKKTVAEHQRIIEAIIARDEKKARNAMRSHLLAARRNLSLSDSK